MDASCDPGGPACSESRAKLRSDSEGGAVIGRDGIDRLDRTMGILCIVIGLDDLHIFAEQGRDFDGRITKFREA